MEIKKSKKVKRNKLIGKISIGLGIFPWAVAIIYCIHPHSQNLFIPQYIINTVIFTAPFFGYGISKILRSKKLYKEEIKEKAKNIEVTFLKLLRDKKELNVLDICVELNLSSSEANQLIQELTKNNILSPNVDDNGDIFYTHTSSNLLS